MRRLLFVAGMILLPVHGSHATLLNFDDGVAGQSIGSYYATLGVSFSNGSWQDNFGLAGVSGRLALASTTGTPYNWTASTPVVATFQNAMSNVSLRAIDLGENGFTLLAYDALTGGNLVSQMTLFGVGLGNNNYQTLSVSGANIYRVEFSQVYSSSPDGVIVENFDFNAPEPAITSLALAGLGLLLGARANSVTRRKPTGLPEGTKGS